MIIKYVTLSEFKKMFEGINNFSNEGLELLYNYLNNCDADVLLDVLHICTSFIELNISEITEDILDNVVIKNNNIAIVMRS